MDSDEGKLFVGGIAWETPEEKLREYFSQFGEVSQAIIMCEKDTGRPRGFGFVLFSDPSVLDRVLEDKHVIDGRQVDVKRAISREEQQASSRSGNYNAGRSSGGPGNFRTKKIFVGGLPSTLTEDEFRQYYENYGQVTDVVIMFDQNTQRPRGFGFITFDNEDAVDRVLIKNFHELNGKLVEVKRALPRDANPGGGGRGGGYQHYGSSGANNNAFDGQMDGNRYMQPQTTPGGFPQYGYGTPGYGYGYGGPNSSVSYGGYGSYGVSGYGSDSGGFGAPSGGYGNPSAPNAGYLTGGPGALKSNWNNQAAAGYGAAGCGANAGYGSSASWTASGSGGVASGPRPGGAAGYGSQGFGYSNNYGGNDGPYGGYGAGGRLGSGPNSNIGTGSGGREQQATGGRYMGSGYGDSEDGYANPGWRSDSTQASGDYGSGYGGGQSRQS